MAQDGRQLELFDKLRLAEELADGGPFPPACGAGPDLDVLVQERERPLHALRDLGQLDVVRVVAGGERRDEDRRVAWCARSGGRPRPGPSEPALVVEEQRPALQRGGGPAGEDVRDVAEERVPARERGPFHPEGDLLDPAGELVVGRLEVPAQGRPDDLPQPRPTGRADVGLEDGGEAADRVDVERGAGPAGPAPGLRYPRPRRAFRSPGREERCRGDVAAGGEERGRDLGHPRGLPAEEVDDGVLPRRDVEFGPVRHEDGDGLGGEPRGGEEQEAVEQGRRVEVQPGHLRVERRV